MPLNFSTKLRAKSKNKKKLLPVSIKISCVKTRENVIDKSFTRFEINQTASHNLLIEYVTWYLAHASFFPIRHYFI